MSQQRSAGFKLELQRESQAAPALCLQNYRLALAPITVDTAVALNEAVLYVADLTQECNAFSPCPGIHYISAGNSVHHQTLAGRKARPNLYMLEIA